MADEAQIRNSLQIKKNDTTDPTIVLVDYRRSHTFNVDVSGSKGPSPGAIEVPTAGVEVDLSELTTPALCWLKNQDPTNFVTYGILDVDGSTFHPLGELLPGEAYPLRLSRSIGDGTGTAYESLFLKADTAACNVLVEAFPA